MSTKLFLIAAATCLPFTLAGCGGGGGGASSAPAGAEAPASGTPPYTDLLSWNQGHATNWHWFSNPDSLPADWDREQYPPGFDELQGDANEQGQFTPNEDSLGRRYSTMPGVLTQNNRLPESYASWGDPVSGIDYLISTNPDADFIRENVIAWNHFDWTSGTVRGVMAHGRYSAFLLAGVFACLEAVCNSSHNRAFIWGKREFPSRLRGDPGMVEYTRGDTAYDWLRNNGAGATWRGAMAGNSLGTGAALVGEAVVTYTASDDSLGLEFSNVKQRDDGTGVIEATYSGPDSFTWTDIKGETDDPHSDYRLWSTNCQHGACGLEIRFYGPNAEEAAGTFETEIPNDKLLGGFVAKR